MDFFFVRFYILEGKVYSYIVFYVKYKNRIFITELLFLLKYFVRRGLRVFFTYLNNKWIKGSFFLEM